MLCHEYGHALAVILSGGWVTNVTTPLFWTSDGSCSYGIWEDLHTSKSQCFISAMGPIIGMLGSYILYRNHKAKCILTRGIKTFLFSKAISFNLCNLLPFEMETMQTDGYCILANTIGTNYTFTVTCDRFLKISNCLALAIAFLLSFR